MGPSISNISFVLSVAYVASTRISIVDKDHISHVTHASSLVHIKYDKVDNLRKPT